MCNMSCPDKLEPKDCPQHIFDNTGKCVRCDFESTIYVCKHCKTENSFSELLAIKFRDGQKKYLMRCPKCKLSEFYIVMRCL